jgi:hypothetical protein
MAVYFCRWVVDNAFALGFVLKSDLELELALRPV